MDFLDRLAGVVYPSARELRAVGASVGREA
jgi:hypothetical protein